jgi:hypothetical protein
MQKHLIFEGAELAGKSWLMSQIYDHLEPKYNQNRVILDGCHWFNCDVGIYGTRHGAPVIRHYLEIFKELKDKNLLVEKLHLSDIVYNRLHFGRELDYGNIETDLAELDFKIILVCFPENETVIKKRIADRLSLYPHYEQILRSPAWYLDQQAEYRQELQKSKLEHLIIETDNLPDSLPVRRILDWIGESQ